MILVGGGVISSGASRELIRVAEFLQAPVLATAEGRGAISDHHPLSLGAMRLRNDPFGQDDYGHDVILAVGTRIQNPQFINGQRVVQIDIDPEELGRNYDDTLGIQGDARLTLAGLYDALSSTMSATPSRQAEIDRLKATRTQTEPRVEPQDSYLDAVRNAMPEDGILIAGMTQMGYYSRAYYPVYEPRTFITSSYSGNLGYAYPVALGAKVAQPDKAVVALSGDGGFLFNSQEMATAVQHGINVVVVVFNDNAYGNVLRDQVTRFDGRSIGAELHNPDFIKLAEAYGVKGMRANDSKELESKLREALELDAPVLIEVPVGMMPTPFT